MTTVAPTRPPADAAVQTACATFYAVEAELLDDRRFREWYAFLTDDFTYQIPVPVTRDDPTLPPYAEHAYIVDETRRSLEFWLRRQEPGFFEYAWGENPPQRTRHFVTNVLARETDTPGEYAVRANLLLGFARQSDPEVLVTASRRDVLRVVDGEWRLARRVVRFDQTVHSLTHVRLIF